MRDAKDWKRLFHVSIAAGALVLFYGIFATGSSNVFLGPNIRSVFTEGIRFYGSLGNATYIGSYLIFALFFLFYVYAEKRQLLPRVLFLLLALFFILFAWMAQTRGPVLGILAGIIAFLIYMAALKWRKWGWKVGVGVFLFLILGVGIFMFRDNPSVQSLPGTRLLHLNFESLSFQSRLWTWNSAVQGIQERPILGWGFENFSVVFNKYFDTRHYIPGEPSETWYDRAHNLLLDRLIESGVLGLASFLAIFVLFYMTLFRVRRRMPDAIVPAHQALLFATPVAYFVQGITIFDVLPISLSLFTFLAFANFMFRRHATNV